MTLQVTEQASARLKELLDRTEHADGQVIRLVPDDQGNSTLVIDVEKEGDQVIDHEGEKVMVIDTTISNALTGATLDVKETPKGTAFTLIRDIP